MVDVPYETNITMQYGMKNGMTQNNVKQPKNCSEQ